MARSNTIKAIRTTRANLNTQAGSANLLAGEPYLITDENRIAIGLTTSTYQDFVKNGEAASLTSVTGLAIALRSGAFIA